MDEETVNRLIDASFDVKEFAYSPYSKFRVGAALLCEDGTIISGCNVENASGPLGNCAEKTAIGTAVSRGHKKFKAVVVSSDMKTRFIVPCGSCRQVLSEFGLDWLVYMTKPDRSYVVKTVRELLPDAFEKSCLDSCRD